MGTGSLSTIDGITERLIRRALQRDVPEDVARHAARATARAMGESGSGRISERRAEAYFSAVVRRRLVRSGGTRAVSRMLAQTVVDDLQRSGRDAAAVWDELQRGWRDTIPDDVLEEYRILLCA